MPQINRLFIETIHAINAQDYTREQLSTWAPKDRSFKRWEQSFADHIVYVAEANNTIIGFGDITKEGYLDHLFTHKDFQGQGIACALLAKLEEIARELGLQEIYTEASITAQPFFSKKGFGLDSRQEKLFNGVIFINYIMRKKLM